MKVLVVSPFFPYPTDSGGKTRLYHLIRELSARHEITLLALIDHTHRHLADKLSSFCRSELVASSPGGTVWDKQRRARLRADSLPRMRSLLGGAPLGVTRFVNREMVNRLRRLTAHERYDLVHFEYLQMTGYLRYLPADTKTIVSAVEVPSVVSEREASAGTAGRVGRLNHRLLVRYEAALFASTGGVVAMSELEAAIIHRRCPRARVFVVPNGVDARLLQLRPARPAGPVLLFVGGAAHSPNVDGLSFFLEGCWSTLRTQFPGVRLRLIGRGWRDLPWLSSYRGIEVIDYCEDQAECYSDASLLLAPIRIGSGTRLKILEAMAAGLPVVSTSIGCEGLEVTNGRQLSIADDAAAFGEAVSHLLLQPKLALVLADRARLHVGQNFLWNTSAERLSQAYDQVSGNGSKGSC
jgi:polysaccharide biosynthesis protein PslH